MEQCICISSEHMLLCASVAGHGHDTSSRDRGTGDARLLLLGDEQVHLVHEHDSDPLGCRAAHAPGEHRLQLLGRRRRRCMLACQRLIRHLCQAQAHRRHEGVKEVVMGPFTHRCCIHHGRLLKSKDDSALQDFGLQ